MMRRSARFDADEARRQLLKEWQNVSALELTTNDYITCCVNSVDLKNRLSNIETDRPDRLHIWLLRVVGALTAPTSMALPCRWRSRPQHQKRTFALQQIASLFDLLIRGREQSRWQVVRLQGRSKRVSTSPWLDACNLCDELETDDTGEDQPNAYQPQSRRRLREQVNPERGGTDRSDTGPHRISGPDWQRLERQSEQDNA